MAIWNPPYQAIRFVEEQVQPTPPQIVSETVVFSLAESITVPANPAVVSETITFDLTESVTVTT